MSELAAFSVVFIALLVLAAVLWIAGAPEIEDRPHLRIRPELQGGRLEAIDVREAA